MKPVILQVAVPVPLPQLFDYLPPLDHPDCNAFQPGQRIKVPFGRRELVGILVQVQTESSYELNKLKHATARIDEQPILSPHLIKLCQWMSQYYHHPIGDGFATILPKYLRSDKSIDSLKLTADSKPQLKQHNYTLTAEQKTAVDTIAQQNTFNVFTLVGVTGSGKTEVYLQAINIILNKGQQALVLVPEIGLTPQTLERFQQRFDKHIVAFHSRLTAKSRAKAWAKAAADQADIVIGTRSAIFSPLPKLGIIIIDESHDGSFTQHSGLRYSGRNVAIQRAKLLNIPIVLGTATPTLETLYNIEQHRFQRLTLSERIDTGTLPAIQCVDLRQQKLTAGISNVVFDHIKSHLARKHQILIFLNRRGFSPVMMCHACGWVANCKYCDAKMVFHKSTRRLHCHHCAFSQPFSDRCADCNTSPLLAIGQGTEQIESVLAEHFPKNTIIRVDRDNTSKKGEMDKLLQKIHDNEAQIIVGTQMLAKGHHFKHLGLVVIIDADSGLYSHDFRATEHMGQLLTQVAGRAGRELHDAEVLIQTHHPNHPLLQTLLSKGYAEFSKQLLAERQQALLPPYSHLALLQAEGRTTNTVKQYLYSLQQALSKPADPHCKIFGPIPANINRKAGYYRMQLLIQSTQRPALHALLERLELLTAQNKAPIRWALSVDPLMIE